MLIPSVYRLGELMAPGKPVNSIVPNSTSTITCVNPALTKANETGLKRPPIAILWDDRIYVGPYLHALPKRDYSVAMRRVALLARNIFGYWLFGSNGVGRKNAQSVGTFLEPF